jgi:hypothetical protein
VAWDLVRRTVEQEERDLEQARELDAAEVGRRADAGAFDASAQKKNHTEQR